VGGGAGGEWEWWVRRAEEGRDEGGGEGRGEGGEARKGERWEARKQRRT
jgi:hypothetical protein